ncbi:MAG TPA: hypothetical protein PLE12_04655 [Propionicimonas sp.]|nr:hypothetical protein [Actinotalea sp.]HRA75507.1 hypothetical protein [Propionicimonas sp.]
MANVPPVPPSAVGSRLVPLWGTLAGIAAGFAWGAMARAWMRLLTTAPAEFSWAGTIGIITLFAVAGGVAGAVRAARRQRWRGRPMIALRLTGMATTLVLSLGQGALLLPTLLCGGLAIARRGWPTWVRVVLAALALAPFVLVHVDAGRAWPHSDARLLAAVVLGAVVYGGAALALAQSYAPTPGGAIPRALLGAPLLLATLTVLLAAGLDPVTALLVTLLVLAAAAVTLALRSRRALALALDDTRPHLTA